MSSNSQNRHIFFDVKNAQAAIVASKRFDDGKTLTRLIF